MINIYLDIISIIDQMFYLLHSSVYCWAWVGGWQVGQDEGGTKGCADRVCLTPFLAGNSSENGVVCAKKNGPFQARLCVPKNRQLRPI
jgi:hypothetical protein